MVAVRSLLSGPPLRPFPQGRVSSLRLLHRHLDDGEPFGGILLIPDTVDINGAGSIGNLVAFLIQIGEDLDISAKIVIFVVIQLGFSKTLKINHILIQKNMKEQVLKAMREAGKPVSAGDVTKVLNADRKDVDKAFAELKKEGAIVSPVRCKWEPAK